MTLKLPVAFSEADSVTNAKSGPQISFQSPLKSVEAIPLTYMELGSGPLWFPCSLKPKVCLQRAQSNFSSGNLDFIASEFGSPLRNTMTVVRNALVIQEGDVDICSVKW